MGGKVLSAGYPRLVGYSFDGRTLCLGCAEVEAVGLGVSEDDFAPLFEGESGARERCSECGGRVKA